MDGSWCRVYHRGRYALTGHSSRSWGPVSRFDPHQPDPAGRPRVDPDGRTVLYVGDSLATSAAEVFGLDREARLCPQWRVARIAPKRPAELVDLISPGAAMALGALPQLAIGDIPRRLTQHWARAVYEDRPTGIQPDGMYYLSAYNGGRAMALGTATAGPAP